MPCVIDWVHQIPTRRVVQRSRFTDSSVQRSIYVKARPLESEIHFRTP
jgi:hypothetical protein